MATRRPGFGARANDTFWFVYVLRCKDESLYTGITKDISRRCEQHQKGIASKYTRSRLPVKLVYQEPQRNQSLALKREAAIKAMTRKQKLAMIRLQKRRTTTAALPLSGVATGRSARREETRDEHTTRGR
ncbi:MAG TPA: GIY-YIG nuclease family protein [Gemmatales bacterium]|nr:GIY-YIG nuclease family protein [Gemmatales bacterium]